MDLNMFLQGIRCITEEALRSIQQQMQSWHEQIEDFVRPLAQNPQSLRESINRIQVNGRPLFEYFDRDQLVELVNSLLTAARSPDFISMVSEVLGILCLLAAMHQNLRQGFRGEDAERAWHAGLANAGLLVTNNAAQQHPQIYDSILNMISGLVNPRFGFWVSIAATFVARLWPERQSIAAWVAANWQVVAKWSFFIVFMGLLVGLLAYLGKRMMRR